MWQIPPMFEPTLRSQPVWSLSDVADNSFIARLVVALHTHWRSLLSEYRALLATEPRASTLAYPELNSNTGNWTKVMLYDGDMGKSSEHRSKCQFEGEPYPPRILHPRLCARLPITCNLVRPLIPGIVD